MCKDLSRSSLVAQVTEPAVWLGDWPTCSVTALRCLQVGGRHDPEHITTTELFTETISKTLSLQGRDTSILSEGIGSIKWQGTSLVGFFRENILEEVTVYFI